MNGKKILKIFMMPQEFPCGEQSSCCGPTGQSEEEIQNLKNSIEEELGYEVEVLNMKNEDDVKGYPRIVQLLQSLGPNALPILKLEDEVVSMGNPTPEKAIAAIREKTEKKDFGKENEMIENDNVEQTRQDNLGSPQACCPSASGSGDCCPPSSGGGKSWKMLVFILVVVAAGVVLARSVIRKSDSATEQGQGTFATIQPEEKSDTPSALNATANAETSAESEASIDSPSAVNSMTEAEVSGKSDTPSPPKATAKVETTVESEGSIDTPSVVSATTEAEVSNETTSNLWGKPLDSLASLNKAAAETDAVFVLLAADDQQNIQPITKEIEAAAKKLQSNGIRVSAFTLKKGAPNYAQLAKQLSVPCVLAMVKGRGLSGVSGEITETKLVQAFVMASRPASGCGPSGCGPVGCP